MAQKEHHNVIQKIEDQTWKGTFYIETCGRKDRNGSMELVTEHSEGTGRGEMIS